MKKWQKKIYRRANHYDKGLDADVELRQKLGVSMMCGRAYRRDGFFAGAEWMLKEITHLMRQKKYKCDKLIREGATTAEKKMPIFAAALYSRIIKDLTE